MFIELPADASRSIPMNVTASLPIIKLVKARLFSAVLRWTGVNAPTGTITAKVGNDPGNLVAYTGTAFAAQPAGSASAIYYELPNGGSCAFKYLQFTYTVTSGGVGDTLTADCAAKG